MAINVGALVAIVIFCLLILIVGVVVAWRKRRQGVEQNSETIMVAKRDIGLIVGSFTMTATWVGGGYINGTAEYVYTPGYGLLWTQAIFLYSFSPMISALFFVKKMRSLGYVTVLDPFQRKLGRRIGGLLFYLPSLCGDVCYTGAILAALGGTVTVITGVRSDVAIIISACIAIVYILVGGLYSVAYTDVVQLICLFVGLWITVPFAITHPAASSIVDTAYGNSSWLGTWDSNYAGLWVDSFFQLTLGGIPIQAFFQRVLSMNSVRNAQLISCIGGVGALVVSVPSILIGAVAASTNWTATSYIDISSLTPAENGQAAVILPIVLQHLTPPVVACIGLGAITAAVMSSVDSAVLASSSVFTRNVYQQILRPKASERELVWSLRIHVVIVAAVASVLAITTESIYVLVYLCTDLVYVLIFPQFIGVLFFDVNKYGSLVAYVLGLILRLGGGEPLLGFTPFISYPGISSTTSNFPIKTFGVIVSFITLLVVSYGIRMLFQKEFLPARYDFLECDLAGQGRGIEPRVFNDDKKVEGKGIQGNENPHFVPESNL